MYLFIYIVYWIFIDITYIRNLKMFGISCVYPRNVPKRQLKDHPCMNSPSFGDESIFCPYSTLLFHCVYTQYLIMRV